MIVESGKSSTPAGVYCMDFPFGNTIKRSFIQVRFDYIEELRPIRRKRHSEKSDWCGWHNLFVVGGANLTDVQTLGASITASVNNILTVGTNSRINDIAGTSDSRKLDIPEVLYWRCAIDVSVNAKDC